MMMKINTGVKWKLHVHIK